jgi:hypothetical protein
MTERRRGRSSGINPGRTEQYYTYLADDGRWYGPDARNLSAFDAHPQNWPWWARAAQTHQRPAPLDATVQTAAPIGPAPGPAPRWTTEMRYTLLRLVTNTRLNRDQITVVFNSIWPPGWTHLPNPVLMHTLHLEVNQRWRNPIDPNWVLAARPLSTLSAQEQDERYLMIDHIDYTIENLGY